MNSQRRREAEGDKAPIEIDPATGIATIGGYEAIDLGLPSGLLWATCNIGASTRSEYGNYYCYGAGSATADGNSLYYNGDAPILPAAYDTALVVMGNGWRMPTKEECEELINNTNHGWKSYSHGNAHRFYNLLNSSILMIIPCAGHMGGSELFDGEGGMYLWTATNAYPDTHVSGEAYYFWGDYGALLHTDYYNWGNCGFPIRAVHDRN